jgi:hypothetical protein
LSGFIDGDGCFYLRCSKENKYPAKFECKFELVQSIKDDDKIHYNFMLHLCESLLTPLKKVNKNTQ